MAKAKPDDQLPDDFTGRVLREVEKEYGEGVLVSGTAFRNTPVTAIPWTPSLDIIGGPIESASWVGLTGNPKTCKSSMALNLAAQAQRPEYGSRPVFYGKVEGRLSHLLTDGTAGLDLSEGRFTLIQSSKGRILPAQEFLDIFLRILKGVPGAFLIIDSISALCDEREMADGIGSETRGGGAKLFSQFLRLAAQVVPVNDSIVVGITHLISNTSGMGAQYVERAARAWSYQCDYQYRVQSKTPWKVGERQVGYQLRVVCNTSKRVPPGMATDAFIRFGLGSDRLYECLNLAEKVGLVRKSGAWYSLDFLKGRPGIPGDIPKFQGAERAYQTLTENEEWARILREEVVTMAAGDGGEE